MLGDTIKRGNLRFFDFGRDLCTMGATYNEVMDGCSGNVRSSNMIGEDTEMTAPVGDTGVYTPKVDETLNQRTFEPDPDPRPVEGHHQSNRKRSIREGILSWYKSVA